MRLRLDRAVARQAAISAVLGGLGQLVLRALFAYPMPTLDSVAFGFVAVFVTLYFSFSVQREGRLVR